MCKKSSTATCLTKQSHDYLLAIANDLKKAQSANSSPSDKRKASEEIGTKAAIAKNAERHSMSFDDSTKQHTEFRGSGVPDLVMKAPDGTLEVKEAKGGKSSYGTRKAATGKKRVKQCTPEYTLSIGTVMKRSNYKGRHPTRACANHGNPVPSCTGCKNAEKDHRRTTGKGILDSMVKKTHRKVAVRGDYNKTCAQVPEVIDNYTVDGKGKAVHAQ